MKGNLWTTLCPAPLLSNPVYPTAPVTANRKGWGCILFDTALNNAYPSQIALEKFSGGAKISDIHWMTNTEGKIYGLGFIFDKTSDNKQTIMKTVSILIRNEGVSGRDMDGDRKTPNGDNKQWFY